jgi:hypothetical protein
LLTASETRAEAAEAREVEATALRRLERIEDKRVARRSFWATTLLAGASVLATVLVAALTG